jgi:hypothetical protein
MPGTFSDSWKLTKTAFRLIAEDRALLIFPLVAGLAILGVLALLLLGWFWLFVSGTSVNLALGLVLFLVAYFGMAFISVYATGALVGAATLKLNGQQPTAADGWRIARAHLGRLALWALITATVGLAIQAISRRVGGVGGLLISVAGGATWAVATYFMVPVILYESEGAWKGLKRSGHLFVSTFGRSLVSNIAVGLIVGAGIVGAVILGVVGLFVVASGAWLLGFVLLGVGIALAVIVALIGAAAEGILRAALYRYATTGKIDPDLLPVGYGTLAGGTASAALP